MLGEILRKRLPLLLTSSTEKTANNAFWIILRDIAREEIIELGEPVDSDTIIPIYYDILSSNLDYIPEYFQEVLPSNRQERYRVINRNLFSSNAFHRDGLANQKGIRAYKEINENKKGERIVFVKE